MLYRGKLIPFEFPYRRPWPWIRSLLMDETLANDIMYHSVLKTFRDEYGQEVRVLDETNTADNWWNMEVIDRAIFFSLPD